MHNKKKRSDMPIFPKKKKKKETYIENDQHHVPVQKVKQLAVISCYLISLYEKTLDDCPRPLLPQQYSQSLYQSI